MQADSKVEKTVSQNTEPEKVSTGTVITTGDSQFGTMLFNDNKQAIYIWELEESTKPECYGDCADAWPPVLTDGAPQAAGSVKNELLGTTKRSDGSTQVTYNGHPLYYYAHEKAGEVKCHNIKTHGGLWWVIQPNGIRAD
jgi:predicted lipoprotein with Yx(FWY)xxD motif